MGQSSVVRLGESELVYEPDRKDFIAYGRATRSEGGFREVEVMYLDPALLKMALAEGFAVIKMVSGLVDRGGIDEHTGDIAVRDEEREKWTREWAKERKLRVEGGVI